MKNSECVMSAGPMKQPSFSEDFEAGASLDEGISGKKRIYTDYDNTQETYAIRHDDSFDKV